MLPSFILNRLCLLLLWLDVGIDKELSKENKETQDVHEVHSNDTKRQLLASVEHKVRGMAHHQSELDQLEQSQTGLPPNGERLASLGILGMHADEVVSVHDSVDETIEQDCKVDVSIIQDIGVEPIEEEDGGVVVYMEEGELTPLLSQNNKDGVPKVPHLGNVKEPKEVTEGGISLVKIIARREGVSVAVRDESRLDGHVRAEEDLRHVVHEFNGIRIHGGEVSHDLLPDEDK